MDIFVLGSSVPYLQHKILAAANRLNWPHLSLCNLLSTQLVVDGQLLIDGTYLEISFVHCRKKLKVAFLRK